jgi:hypothetical protein
MLVLRIPVDDKDEEKTPNWNARFVITQGNENGNFRIDTDPETNEGLLYVIKVTEITTTTDESTDTNKDSHILEICSKYFYGYTTMIS